MLPSDRPRLIRLILWGDNDLKSGAPQSSNDALGCMLGFFRIDLSVRVLLLTVADRRRDDRVYLVLIRHECPLSEVLFASPT